MTTRDLGTAVLTLQANTSEYRRDLENAEHQSSRRFDTMRRGAQRAGVAIAGIGAAAFKLADDYNRVASDISNATGRTGIELTNLLENTQGAANMLPLSFAEVKEFSVIAAQAAQDADADLTLLIATLGALSESGQNVNENWAPFFNSIASTFNMDDPALLDFLEDLGRIAQKTGIPVGSLLRAVSEGRFAFEDMGIAADESGRLLGNLDLSVQDLRRAVSEMNTAWKAFVEQGGDAEKELQEIVDALSDGEQSTADLERAADLLGDTLAEALAQALRDGVLDFEDLTTATDDAGESFLATYLAGLTLGEEIDVLRTNAQDTAASFLAEHVGIVAAITAISTALVAVSTTAPLMTAAVAAITIPAMMTAGFWLGLAAAVGVYLAALAAVRAQTKAKLTNPSNPDLAVSEDEAEAYTSTMATAGSAIDPLGVGSGLRAAMFAKRIKDKEKERGIGAALTDEGFAKPQPVPSDYRRPPRGSDSRPPNVEPSVTVVVEVQGSVVGDDVEDIISEGVNRGIERGFESSGMIFRPNAGMH